MMQRFRVLFLVQELQPDMKATFFFEANVSYTNDTPCLKMYIQSQKFFVDQTNCDRSMIGTCSFMMGRNL